MVPSGQSGETIESVLAAVRELLGMEAAYLAEFVDGRQLYRAVDGAAESFGLRVGDGPRAEGTYCRRMLDGALPNVIPDTSAEARVRDLEITRAGRIGSYASVPLSFPDGTRGTICCLSHEPDAALADRDIRFMHAIARLVEDRLVREHAEREARDELDREVVQTTADLRMAVSRLNIASVESVLLLSKAVDYRDDDTGAHTARVGRYASRLAAAAGLDGWLSERLLLAAPLHDAGKIAVPDAILLKPGPLTDEERAVMQTHAQLGFDLLSGSSSEVLDLAASVALTHHEHYDGGGYPHGLVGDEIPIEGRVAAIADVFDALSQARVYRPALAREEVVALLRDGRGTHFDPELLDAFLADLPDPGP
jgi:hypothetical protein